MYIRNKLSGIWMKMDAGYILQIDNYFQQANISQLPNVLKPSEPSQKNCLPSYPRTNKTRSLLHIN